MKEDLKLPPTQGPAARTLQKRTKYQEKNSENGMSRGYQVRTSEAVIQVLSVVQN
jgi:hypothetical protein